MAEKKEREEKIRELEEKMKRLEEQQEKRKRGGAAGGVLRGLGDVIPGLGKMLEGLEDSEAFQERLDTINKEVDKKFRETPLKRVESGGIGIGLGGIPRKGSIPRVERDFSIETLAHEKPAVKKQARKPRPKEEKVEKEVVVDIFEEDKYLKVIAELPGVEEKDIKVELKEDSLTISADTPYRKYYKEVALPCPVKGEPVASYKNGILEIELEKEG